MSEPATALSPGQRTALGTRLAAGGADAEGFRLGPMQEQMWALEQLDPGLPDLLIVENFRLRGPLDAERLRGAAAAVIARHEVLRSRFGEFGGAPWQWTDEAGDWWHYTDLSGLPPPTAERRLERAIAEWATGPFDLEGEPPIRLGLIRLAPGEHALLITLHHIVSDGWSMQILLRELADAYAGTEAPPLDATYADYAAWQREMAASVLGDEAVAYWRDRLGDAPTPVQLPFADPAAGRGERPAQVARFLLEGEAGAALHRLTARQGATRFEAWLALLHGFLSHYGGASDLVIGTPTGARPFAELEQAIGLFVNMLALRLAVPQTASLEDAAAIAAEASQAMLRHQHVPFRRAIDALAIEADGRRSPLFNAALVYDNFPVPRLDLPGIAAEALPSGPARALYDLNLFVREQAGGFAVEAAFHGDAFDAAGAQALTRHFEHWCHAALASPATPLCDVPLRPPGEAPEPAIVARHWPRADTIHGLFAEMAAAHPDAPAVIAEDATLTYAELDAAANRLAHALIRRGVSPDDRVGIFMRRGSALIVAIMGVIKAGAGYVPFDPDYPPARLAMMIADACVSICVTGPDDTCRPPGEAVACLRYDLPGEAAAPGDDLPPGVAVAGSNLLYMMFTSGSTGRPRAVMNVHGGVRNRMLTLQDDYALGPGDRVLNKTTFSFDVSVWEIFLPLVTGAAVVVPAPGVEIDPSAIVEVVRRRGVTMLHFIPPMMRLFLEEPDVGECRSLRIVASGGELLPRGLQQRFFSRLPGSRLSNHYGPTEAAIEVTRYFCGPTDPLACAPIGSAVDNVSCHVLDAWLRPVPDGIAGQLYAGGIGPARGYFDAGGLTADRFLPDPAGTGARLYRTGDLVRRLGDGDIEFLGRLDHQVKVRGFRIELGEVQATIAGHPQVRDAVVTAEHDRSGTLALIAYVVGDGLDSGALATWLGERLPPYMVPSSLRVIERIPLTATGKVDRDALRALVPEEIARFEPVRPGGEARLAAIWRELLGADCVGRDENFFRAGGQSLLVIRLRFEIEREFGIRLALRTLYEKPTIAEQAALLDAGREVAPSAPLAPAPVPDPVCSFSEERLWFIEQLQPGGTAYNVPLVFEVAGVIDAARLARAWQATLAAHEILRTSYAERDGVPVPRVAPAGPAMAVIDLAALTQSEREAAREATLAELAARPFDLARETVRATWIAERERRGTLAIVLHHIVTDGWSARLLIETLSRRYAEDDAGPADAEHLLRDRAAARRAAFAAGADAPGFAWWRERLAPLVGAPPLRLPVDRTRPRARTGAGGLCVRTLADATSAGLAALQRDQGLTAFAVHGAVYALLLARFGNGARVNFGTPVADRPPGCEAAQGLFANTAVILLDMDEGEPPLALARRLHLDMAEMLEHGDMPLDQLVQHLNPDRDLAHNPLFDTIFSVDRDLGGSLALGEARARMIDVDSGGAKFDLELTVVEAEAGTRLVLLYNSDVFSAGRAAAILAELEEIAAAFVAAPERPLAPLREAAAAPAPPLDPRHHPRRALATGRSLGAGRIAARHGERTLSYGDLEQGVDALAERLGAEGVGTDTIVAVRTSDPLTMLTGIHAVLRAGGAYLPITAEEPADRVARTLAQAGVELVIGGTAGDCRVERIAGRTPPRRGRLVPHREALTYCLTTSGSTGAPKLAGTTDRGYARLLQYYLAVTGMGPDDRVLGATSMVFDVMQKVFIGVIAAGAQIVWRADSLFDPWAVREAIARHDITGILCTSTMLATLLDAPAHELARMATLRWLIIGGEAFPREVADRWHRSGLGARLINAYGVAECADVSASCEILPEAAGTVPVGPAIVGNRVHVLDGALREAPIGNSGVVHFGGDAVGRGYIGQPATTAAVFLPDPFGPPGSRLYRTGDRGRCRADGWLEILGRIDDQVKIRGFRVETGEVEHALLRHAEVRNCAVLARRGTSGDARLEAHVELARPGTPPEALTAFLAERLPDYMVPAAIRLHEALPRNSNGKIDRGALAREAPAVVEQPVEADEPILDELMAIWRGLLDGAAIALDSNFFAGGGHSLLAVRLAARMRDAFAVDVPVRMLFLNPTPRSQADFVIAQLLALEDADAAAAAAPVS